MSNSIAKSVAIAGIALSLTLGATTAEAAHKNTGKIIAGAVLGLTAAAIIANQARYHDPYYYYYDDYGYYHHGAYPPGRYYRHRRDDGDGHYYYRQRNNCDPRWDPIGQGGVC